MHISPRKLIQEPQMRSCSISNNHVLSRFRNESKLNVGSFMLAGRSFQIVQDCRPLNDLGPNVPECSAALRWQIAKVSDRVSQKLRCSRLPDKKAPVHSNIGTSEWRSWKLSFVAMATNGGCATLAWCDRISEYQWWTVLPRSGHSADVAWIIRWHRTVDCCSSQADLLQTPMPTSMAASVVNELRMVRSCLSWKKHERHIAVRWSCMVMPNVEIQHRDWILWWKIECWQTAAGTPWCRLWQAVVWILSISPAFCRHSSSVCCCSSRIRSYSVQLTNLWTAVSTSAAPVPTCTSLSSA